jgi:hypothetical protein
VALTEDELAILNDLQSRLTKSKKDDDKFLSYYRGKQKFEQLGLAIPHAMQRFLVFANWCRVLVDTKDDRMRVRTILLPGQDVEDDRMRGILNTSKIDTQLSLFNKDALIFNRSYFVVGSVGEDERTVIRAASPRQMVTIIDPLTGLETAAAQFYKLADDTEAATFYTPERTVHLIQDKSGWVDNPDAPADNHNLGVVPVVTHFNRRITGEFQGESELTDLIPLVDAQARALTNLQFAQESNGVPHKYITGITDQELRNPKNGKKFSLLDMYYNAISLLGKDTAKMGQLPAADLKNFSEALLSYATQAAAVTALPVSYWGVTTANPQSEGAIIADESRFVKDVESDMALIGDALGRAAAIAWRNETGQELEWQPKVEWYEAATQTLAQREDALSKRRQAGALSVRGYLTALGKNETEIDREMEWLEEEAQQAAEAGADPILSKLSASFSGSPAQNNPMALTAE